MMIENKTTTLRLNRGAHFGAQTRIIYRHSGEPTGLLKRRYIGALNCLTCSARSF
jgi:hypothetical protein